MKIIGGGVSASASWETIRNSSFKCYPIWVMMRKTSHQRRNRTNSKRKDKTNYLPKLMYELKESKEAEGKARNWHQESQKPSDVLNRTSRDRRINSLTTHSWMTGKHQNSYKRVHWTSQLTTTAESLSRTRLPTRVPSSRATNRIASG